jgi:hypothetical protein
VINVFLLLRNIHVVLLTVTMKLLCLHSQVKKLAYYDILTIEKWWKEK